MTNGWVDMKNTDMMLIMGGNPAENHPCGFKWPVEAKRNRDAKIIVVDPRFTRTASQADIFCQIRVGADLAFLGGLINYAIANNRIAHEYLVNYTNAAFIVKDGFTLPEDGLFSGFDPATKSYNKATWNYEGGGNETPKEAAAGAAAAAPTAVSHAASPAPHSANDHPQGSKAQSPPKDTAIRPEDPRARRPCPALPLRRRCRQMSLTTSRCKTHAVSFSC